MKISWLLVFAINLVKGNLVVSSIETCDTASTSTDSNHNNSDHEISNHMDSYSSSFLDHSINDIHFHSRYCPNNIDDVIPAPMLDINCQCEYFYPGSLTLNKNLANCDIEDVIKIKNLVSKHGVLVLNNVIIDNDDELLNFTSKFGEMIQLPDVFTKQSHSSDYVAVITNIYENGTVDTQDKTAGYWHNDGDFWYDI